MNASCTTCKYESLSVYEEPCRSCRPIHSNYEPGSSIEKVFEDIKAMLTEANLEFNTVHDAKNNAYFICMKEKRND